MRIALIHGFGGSPKSAWFPWLTKQMKGVECIVPKMPHPDAPKLEEWLATLRQEVGSVQDTILIGYSLGGVAALRYLMERTHEERAVATVLIATPFDKCKRPPIENFFTRPWNWEMVRARAGGVYIFQSDDDPIVPLDHAYSYANLLTGTVIQTTENGHFEQKTFPGLVALAKQLAKGFD